MKYPVASAVIGDREIQTVLDALRSGWVSSQGRYVDEFEARFSAYCETSQGVSSANGTVALHLALAAVGVEPGDEVIVPDLTFAATAEAVRHAGATPVCVDVEETSWGLDPRAFEAAITRRTRAVIPVHLYGHPCDMDAVLRVAESHDLWVIEDAAEAHGATYKGRRVGGLGDIGVFSFYGNKLMTTGEGGICVTDDQALAERMRRLRSHGQTRRYWHEELGWNYRLTNLQAALGVAQLDRLDEVIRHRRELGAAYARALRGSAVTPAPEASWAQTVYWLYSALVPAERDGVMDRLATRGIETRPFFYPMHSMPPFAQAGDFPVTTRLSRHGLNLPSTYEMSVEDARLVASELLSALHGPT